MDLYSWLATVPTSQKKKISPPISTPGWRQPKGVAECRSQTRGGGGGGVLGPEIRYFDPWENGQKRQLRIQIEQEVPCRLPFCSLFSPSCAHHLSLPQVRLSCYKQLRVVTSHSSALLGRRWLAVLDSHHQHIRFVFQDHQAVMGNAVKVCVLESDNPTQVVQRLFIPLSTSFLTLLLSFQIAPHCSKVLLHTILKV